MLLSLLGESGAGTSYYQYGLFFISSSFSVLRPIDRVNKRGEGDGGGGGGSGVGGGGVAVGVDDDDDVDFIDVVFLGGGGKGGGGGGGSKGAGGDGGRVEHSINKGGAPPIFRTGGQNYHRIGSLLPLKSEKPKFAQLYIYDTENEITNRMESFRSNIIAELMETEIVSSLKVMMDENNVLAKAFRSARDRYQIDGSADVKLRLITRRNTDARTYNLPTASEVAALILGDIDESGVNRDIIIETKSRILQRIEVVHPMYLALQYPLLFSYGEDGYRLHIATSSRPNVRRTEKRSTISMRDFFAYRLQRRTNESQILLRSRRLLQQFTVDAYTMVESERLLYLRLKQPTLRLGKFKQLHECMVRGETNAVNTGQRIILPKSFTCGPRYMFNNCKDAFTICKYAGYPSYFITMTYCLTIEFQKRGLPHAHLLLFMHPESKPRTVDDIDKVIKTEISDKRENPKLYAAVEKYMVHGPCGHLNSKSQCMINGKCSKFFPKAFRDRTIIDEAGFPRYQRRDDGRTVSKKNIKVDNSFIVPYNPGLFLKFGCYINVEYTCQTSAIKYLFKYISACEAAWRLFGYPIQMKEPAVIRLPFHLPDDMPIVYKDTDTIQSVVETSFFKQSMLIGWFKANEAHNDKARLCAIGRISHIPPMNKEDYYLRLLLNIQKGCTSFSDLRTVDGVVYDSFKDVCYALGLLQDDREFIDAISEAGTWHSATF
ncbi:uncharacterized protein LOC107610403 [Arachis ipaensis]|uniref:uncharacterized protein LOC107610403 n=1 Tax=Arachis ipaensis TaxID=130454 RepID=UPI000A2B3A5D|nr:uncharacterized protein LOC107610403 [Arachis ipaensis]